MPGLDTKLIMHHLSIAPRVKFMKQKLRKMHPHVALLVNAKLGKLLKLTLKELLTMLSGFPILFLFPSMTSPSMFALISEI